jgi:hypothetical protein
VFCLDQLFFVFFCFSLNNFDQSLFLFDSSLFDRQSIFGFDLCNLLFDFCFGDESFRESLEIGREEDRMCPTCFLTPETTELIADSIVSGLG